METKKPETTNSKVGKEVKVDKALLEKKMAQKDEQLKTNQTVNK